MPILTNQDYSGIEIGGDTTGPRFLDIYFADTEYKADEIKKNREDMLKYCELDTIAEILILDKLKEVVK